MVQHKLLARMPNRSKREGWWEKGFSAAFLGRELYSVQELWCIPIIGQKIDYGVPIQPEVLPPTCATRTWVSPAHYALLKKGDKGACLSWT